MCAAGSRPARLQVCDQISVFRAGCLRPGAMAWPRSRQPLAALCTQASALSAASPRGVVREQPAREAAQEPFPLARSEPLQWEQRLRRGLPFRAQLEPPALAVLQLVQSMPRSPVFPAPKVRERQARRPRVWLLPLLQASSLLVCVLALAAWAAWPELEEQPPAVLRPRFVEGPPLRPGVVLRRPQALWLQQSQPEAWTRLLAPAAERWRAQAWAAEQSSSAPGARQAALQQSEQAWPASPKPSRLRALQPCSGAPGFCALLPLVPASWPEWPSSRRRAWRRGKDRFSV